MRNYGITVKHFEQTPDYTNTWSALQSDEISHETRNDERVDIHEYYAENWDNLSAPPHRVERIPLKGFAGWAKDPNMFAECASGNHAKCRQFEHTEYETIDGIEYPRHEGAICTCDCHKKAVK